MGIFQDSIEDCHMNIFAFGAKQELCFGIGFLFVLFCMNRKKYHNKKSIQKEIWEIRKYIESKQHTLNNQWNKDKNHKGK